MSNTSAPWNDETKRSLIACANNVSRHEDYPHSRDVDNCGACALNGYTETDAPNYAGWLRIYLALGRPVPRKHYETEMAYASAENVPYHDAILRDVATFGIRWEGEE